SALASVYGRGSVVLGPLSRTIARLPASSRRVPELAAVRDVASAHPRVAAAVLRGLLADDPPAEDDRSLAGLDMPALVIGHPGDPLHVIEDARRLAERLPRGEFLRAPSFVNYRLRPGELAGHLRRFLAAADDEWVGS